MPQYSFKDFTGRNLRLENFKPGIIIEASCFSQEKPDTEMFPDDMSGVTFLHCNLDNVFIPPGNIITDCSQRRFEVQNDLQDWELDDDDNPVRPVNYKRWEKAGLPLPDPAEIPKEKIELKPDDSYPDPVRELKEKQNRIDELEILTADVAGIQKSGITADEIKGGG